MDSVRIKVLLIDALNVIRRVYEALPDKDTAAGVDHTVNSTLSTINRILEEIRPTHALCVFDGGPPTWRHELYPDYKANRPPTPDPVKTAASRIGDGLKERGIATAVVEQVEADDVIATVARGLDRRGITTVIVSTDQGYSQLLSDHVSIFHHVSGEYRNTAWAEKKFGVTVALIPQFMALRGSTSDNIHGVLGIGPKKAAALLERYGSVDALLANGHQVEGKIGEQLRGHTSGLRLALTLVTLKTDVHVGINLSDMRFGLRDNPCPHGADTAVRTE